MTSNFGPFWYSYLISSFNTSELLGSDLSVSDLKHEPCIMPCLQLFICDKFYGVYSISQGLGCKLWSCLTEWLLMLLVLWSRNENQQLWMTFEWYCCNCCVIWFGTLCSWYCVVEHPWASAPVLVVNFQSPLAGVLSIFYWVLLIDGAVRAGRKKRSANWHDAFDHLKCGSV